MSLLSRPRVSIGMPVYNGENYIERAISSILAQTYKDFELIISDNASTDKTQEICKMFVGRDNRVRYHRNSKNIGAARNYNIVFRLSRGKYFKWAAHDDELAPAFLEDAVNVLEKNKDVVLTQSEVNIINEKSEVTGKYLNRLINMGSSQPSERYGDYLLADHACFDVFGLMRRDVLANTKLHRSHLAADRNLLAELALLGRFYKIPAYLFYIRDHSERSVHIESDKIEELGMWFDPKNKGKRLYMYPRLLLEYFKSIHRVKLNVTERIRAYRYLGRWFWKFKKSILNDLIHYNPMVNALYRGYKKVGLGSRKSTSIAENNF